ncbi:hypothetical protein MKEN_00227000 [Mycena kentingensis (nom. inval.)]|nr:hypothetical protein MKEN_00227000 [Mycena kentingensis (nom. inval.)]
MSCVVVVAAPAVVPNDWTRSPSSSSWMTRSQPVAKPRLRLPLLAAEPASAPLAAKQPRSLYIPAPPTTAPPAPAPEPSPSTSAVSPSPVVVVRPGRKRSPSFSAGPGCTLADAAASPPSISLVRPSLSPPRGRCPPPSLQPIPASDTELEQQAQATRVPPFLARAYPTPDARKRLVARSLLRIHAVGRPRPPCAFPSGRRCENGYENECGGRGYVPSPLSLACSV